MIPSTYFTFGSQNSLDIDRAYVISELPSLEECKAFCKHPTENRNLIVLKEGFVTECFKGLPDEMNNALFYTTSLHSQEFENPIQGSVHRIVPLKIVRATRLILSLLSQTSYRPLIKDALRSYDIRERIEVVKKIDFSSLTLSPNTLKSIAFQIGQSLLLLEGKEAYTKDAIGENLLELQPFLQRKQSSLSSLNMFRDTLLEGLKGIYVRKKGFLNLFCYENGPAIDEWNQFHRQCRGMVIDVKKERCVYYPADKFWRVGEVPETKEKNLSKKEMLEVAEKVDGSMVSCFLDDGKLQFHCKGNFDVAQSKKAEEISKQYEKFSTVNFERYSHVFEVIYPENRFPDGLCVTDYREKTALVLTGVRDRITNKMQPYKTVLFEAKKAGLPHPEIFEETLETLILRTQTAKSVLDKEGYVARFANGTYIKIKYPAYMEVLKWANEMRRDRFIRKYFALEPEAREKFITMLPEEFLKLAKERIKICEEIQQKLKKELKHIVSQKEKEFPEYVLNNIKPEFQKALFRCWRGGLGTMVLEPLAVKIYDKKLTFPIENLLS